MVLQKLEKICEILNDENNCEVIWSDNGKKCITANCIEYEIDDIDEDRIYYDVKTDIWGTYANIDLKYYKNNLEKTIIKILSDNGIECRITKRGEIKLK